MRSIGIVVSGLLALASLGGCKKRPEMDLPLMPGSFMTAGGGIFETPESVQIHRMLEAPSNISKVREYYQQELTARGWTVVGPDTWSDGNLLHEGEFGKDGFAKPKNPAVGGGWVSIIETNRATLIDLWQSFPTQ
jgi:hypothetical protein